MSRVPLNTRINETDLENFRKRCKTEFSRDPNDVVRELIQAFAEDRITITPTEAQKNERSKLYHES